MNTTRHLHEEDEGQLHESSIVRYAVVGSDEVARTAVLPAFAHAHHAELVALVCDDVAFRDDLREHYRIEHAVGRDRYEDLLLDGVVDAVYLTVPSDERCELAVRAAQAGVHVLCEQPMAISREQCQRMVMAAEENDVRLMVAHRPDFEPAHLEVLDELEEGVLGDVRFLEATYSVPLRSADPRRRPCERGGGALFELGVYCVHAARELFRDDPIEVVAFSHPGDPRHFDACDQTSTAMLRFADGRLATFTVSFGAATFSNYRIVGTEGQLEMRPAFEHGRKLSYTVLYEDGARFEKTFEKRDTFAPELVHFSRCVLEAHRPHPDGAEGAADVRILCALRQSIEEGRPIALPNRLGVSASSDTDAMLPGLF